MQATFFDTSGLRHRRPDSSAHTTPTATPAAIALTEIKKNNPEVPTLETLPTELLTKIADSVNWRNLIDLSRTCKAMHKALYEPNDSNIRIMEALLEVLYALDELSEERISI